MIGILIIIVSTIFAGALQWWPYTASGRVRRGYPWDWLMHQDWSTSDIEIKAALEVHPANALAEQLAQVVEKGSVRPRREPRGAHVARNSATSASQDRLVA